MNRQLRHIASIVLLATYLPMVLLSSLHIHHETVDTDDGCQQCVGHFDVQHQHQSDCQYCNFLGQVYLAQAETHEAVLLPEAGMLAAPVSAPMHPLRHGVVLLRAPPTA